MKVVKIIIRYITGIIVLFLAGLVLLFGSPLYFLFVYIPKSIYTRRKKFLKIKQQNSDLIKEINDLSTYIRNLNESLNERFNLLMNYKYSDEKSSEKIYPKCNPQFMTDYYSNMYETFFKYSNIGINTGTLEEFEKILSDLDSATEGHLIMQRKMGILLKYQGISKYFSKFNRKHILEKLEVKYDTKVEILYHHFHIVNPVNNYKKIVEYIFDKIQLNLIINYLYNEILKEHPEEANRAVLTSKLKEEIIERDNNTCRICGASKNQEINLLLGIEYIVSPEDGGEIDSENLQTVCWKCNS